MDKKHKIIRMLPFYFGIASVMMLLMSALLVAIWAPDWIISSVFFCGAACTLAGFIAAVMSKGKSKKEHVYRCLGVIICVIMLLIYLWIAWFLVNLSLFAEDVLSRLWEAAKMFPSFAV